VPLPRCFHPAVALSWLTKPHLAPAATSNLPVSVRDPACRHCSTRSVPSCMVRELDITDHCQLNELLIRSGCAIVHCHLFGDGRTLSRSSSSLRPQFVLLDFLILSSEVFTVLARFVPFAIFVCVASILIFTVLCVRSWLELHQRWRILIST